jgi:UPF0716 family protein affecting phage T7 exclusion
MRENPPFRGQSGVIFLRRPWIWILLWLALEILALKLLAGHFGLGTTLLLLVFKSGIGLGLVILMTGSFFAGATRQGFSFVRLERIGIGLMAGLMLMMPGVVLSILVLALMAPGIRAMIRARFEPPSRQTRDDLVDLEPGEWRDVTPETQKLDRKD